MTHDEHDPTQLASGSTNNTTDGATSAVPKTARTSRRRHPSSRSRQPKEQKQATETTAEATVQPVATAAEVPTPQAAQPAAEAAAVQTAPAATATASVETPQRTATRGRRGGGNRRRSKAETPDVQLVPVVSEPEPSAQTTALESPQESSLPAPDPLPLDAAILAHLDALEEANAQRAAHESAQEIEHAGEAESPAEPSPVTPEARRYRFDRPRPQIATTAPTVRTERLSGWRATPPTLITPPPVATPASEEREEPAARAESELLPAMEPVEDIAADMHVPETGEVVEAEESPIALAAPETTTETEEASATAEAEEAGEHDGAGRRRRRGRGRNRRAQDGETGEGESDEQQEQPAPRSSRLPAPYAAPETAVTYARDYTQSNGFRPGSEAIEAYEDLGYGPYTPTPTPAPRTRATRSNVPATRQPNQPEPRWSMSDAQQHIQETDSPFGAPEPSFAPGFGPQPSGVASPLHESPTRTRRGERAGEAPPMSANQLGAVITNAIMQQTDRLLGELRRQQTPPAMTLALPAFPTTERIGVFVDVANLLYSARNQHMTIDFGRLLDFLRSNRRLIRAHAYAPTNPDPHAEQTFLAAVKGVGYRITTKNYKTFASGARKADMDLDLCMDIVRMVDAGALDTVVLVSGDSDFLPLLEYCSDHGVRVEVAAFEDAAAMILRQSCDLFINLSQVDEIRA